jgi:alanyl-tRNA synthetase
VNEQSVEEAKQGQDVLILTNQTPFYGESGGQMGDHGVLTTEEGTVVVITDTMKKVGSLHVHVAHIQKGQLKTGQAVKLSVDRDRRCQLAANHSATHLLHAVLRQTLGKHVAQKGSLVAPDRLRFDFTHPRPVTVDEMKQVEKAVNQRILDNQPTFTRLMTPDHAVEQEGALALFGERYGDEVRVVSMSDSVELCGGTHVERLGNIGLFKITGESSVSAGIRRIEAITGTAILALLNDTQQTLSGEREQSRKQVVELQKQLTDIKRQSLLEGESDKAELVEIKGYRAMVHHLKGVPAHDLKALVDRYKQTLGSGLVIVTSVVDDKVALVIGVTPDLTDRVDAVKLVKAGAEILGGQGGGGRADLAQAGGSKPENISQLVETFIQFLAD